MSRLRCEDRTGRARRSIAAAGRLALVAALVSTVGLAGCRSAPGGTRTFCAQVKRVPVITERDDLTVPDTATATKALVTELRRLQEAAPAQIRGDVSVLVGVAEDVSVALSNGDEASVEAAKQRVAKSIEAWKAASDNVVSYASSTCGIDLGSAR